MNEIVTSSFTGTNQTTFFEREQSAHNRSKTIDEQNKRLHAEVLEVSRLQPLVLCAQPFGVC